LDYRRIFGDSIMDFSYLKNVDAWKPYKKENLKMSIEEEVKAEVDRATSIHGPFASAHEGYAVLLEEVDELWDEVKKKKQNRDLGNMRKEAIQIAAMAVRFVKDICDPQTHPVAVTMENVRKARELLK
jgi:hypothetical protein